MLNTLLNLKILAPLIKYIFFEVNCQFALKCSFCSSSWDSTAKVWKVSTPHGTPMTLKGHQAAVWAAVELGNKTYATASADKAIKLWKKDGDLISTLTGNLLL